MQVNQFYFGRVSFLKILLVNYIHVLWSVILASNLFRTFLHIFGQIWCDYRTIPVIFKILALLDNNCILKYRTISKGHLNVHDRERRNNKNNKNRNIHLLASVIKFQVGNFQDQHTINKLRKCYMKEKCKESGTIQYNKQIKKGLYCSKFLKRVFHHDTLLNTFQVSYTIYSSYMYITFSCFTQHDIYNVSDITL
jgi:hypothetical protein